MIMDNSTIQMKNSAISIAAARLSELHIEYQKYISLKSYSSFNIGGMCDLAVFPKSKNELVLVYNILCETKIRSDVIGRGSNVLFSDSGYKGALVFTSHMRNIRAKNTTMLVADAGANLTSISAKAASLGLAGLEFACGIPGSCGGAVYMNAGAYGGEISDVLEYSEYYDAEKGTFIKLSNAEHQFSYRKSIYSGNPGMIITEVGFKLMRDNIIDIKARMNENTLKRKMTQPFEYHNAGSTFKRPIGGFAAKMIDECGLKGLSVGDAQVSEKHAGFIVNKGNASSSDVLELISQIKAKVLDRFGVELECEIRIIE